LLAELETKTLGAERGLARLDEALLLANQVDYRCDLAFLHRLPGEILLQVDPGNPAPAEEAFRNATAIAKEQGARSGGLRAALSLAKLYQSTARPVEAHAVLAPALEGFSPTPEMPEIAEAQALLATLAETEEVRAQVAQRHRVTQLHVAYGNALIAARGFGAPETREAFARARESAVGEKRAPERLAADYGLWASSYTRGELPSMRAHASALLADVETQADSPEAGVAYRVCGVTSLFAKEYADARDLLERALALFEPGRDDDLAFRFGIDVGVAAMANLAISTWALGNVEAATSLVGRMQARIGDVKHVNTRAFAKMNACMLELMRRDRMRVVENALELASLVREYDLTMFRGSAAFLKAWANASVGASGNGLEGMRRGVELLREQNVLWFDGLLKIALAEAEQGAGDADRAVALIDEGLATAERTGYRAFEAELHRARGEILLKRDLENPASAEEAFLAAIAVAKQQGTRSFQLRAALSLAKMYRSTSRPADAHAILASALEGFMPTPEMPEIAEAHVLLEATLGETEEVKAAVARKRRLHLQTTLAHAEMWSKGFAAEETANALARAVELTTKAGEYSERLAAAHVQWTMAIARGELSMARELASAMLREAEDRDHRMEASVARRGLVLIYYFSGAFLEARSQCERALADCDPERDQEVRERFGDDIGTVVMSILAVTAWMLGEVDRARELIDGATLRATKLGHRVSEAHPLICRSILELLRGDATAALSAAEDLDALSREQGMAFWLAHGEIVSGWARGHLGDPVLGAAQLQRALTSYADQGARMSTRFYKGLLAEIEAQTLGVECALARIEEALSDADQVEYRWDLAFIHRLHGNLLLKRDPDDPAAAEVAFQTAIAVAKEQGARSYELLASLSLAKLYQSTERPDEAYAVLAPPLEGFSPTPEMPEIAEALALLAALNADAHVGHK
jgi:predicted ATPase